jgi:hypothetical protein
MHSHPENNLQIRNGGVFNFSTSFSYSLPEAKVKFPQFLEFPQASLAWLPGFGSFSAQWSHSNLWR